MPSALFVTTVDITLEAFLQPIAAHLRAQGWTVDALANSAAANPRITEAFDDCYDASWHRNPLHPDNIRAGSTVRRLVEYKHYDVVHVHTPVAAFVTRYALSSLPDDVRPAVIYTAHGFHFFIGGSPAANAAFRLLERTAARWTDLLVTINAEDLAAARSFKTIDPEKVRLMPGIGVDCERYRPEPDADRRAAMRQSLDVGPETFLVAMVAEFAPLKRHAFALQALAACGRDDVVLCLIGSGPLESRLRETVVAHSLSDRVRFAGYRRDVPQLLAASDALLLCSVREGLARSVLEAMATGLPVLGTDTRGIADPVAGAGWIVGRDDAAALGAAMAAAAADRDEAATRGRIARERACELYSQEHVLAEHDELYRDALAIRSQRPRD